MNKKRNYAPIKLIPIFLTLLLVTQPVKGDKKYFGRSYTSYTLPARALEMEIWQTGSIGKGAGYYSRWEPRIELEYGITDRLTGSMYLNFSEVKSSNNDFQPEPLSLSTTSFEFRYRLSNPDEWFVDPAFYFEVGYGGDKAEYEPKILLTKRIGSFISAININSEIERGISEGVTVSAFELTMGVAYEFNSKIAIGFEFWHDRDYSGFYKKEDDQASYIGPTVSFQSDKMYIVLNFLAQISGRPSTNNNLDLLAHEKYAVRAIVGIEL